MKLYFYNKYDGDPSYIFLPQNGFDRLERVDCMGFWSNLFFFAILVFICTRQKSGRRGANMDRLVFFAKFIDFNWHCSLKLTRIAKKFFAKIEEKISIMTIYKIVVQDDNLQNSCPGGQFPKNCRQQRSAKNYPQHKFPKKSYEEDKCGICVVYTSPVQNTLLLAIIRISSVLAFVAFFRNEPAKDNSENILNKGLTMILR